MAAEDIEARLANALVTEYGCPEKEQDALRRVRALIERHRPEDGAREDFATALEWWLRDIPNKRGEHKRLAQALRELKWYVATKGRRRSRAVATAVATWVLEHPGQAAAALGVLLAVILRVSYAQFYGRLGTSPDEVGLDSAELLAASLPGALIILAAITGLVALISVPQMAVMEATEDRWLDRGRGQQSNRDLVIFLGLVALNALGLYLVVFAGLLDDVIPVPLSMSNTALGAMIGGIGGGVGAIFGTPVGALIPAVKHYHRGLRPYVTIRARSLSKAFSWKWADYCVRVPTPVFAPPRSRAG